MNYRYAFIAGQKPSKFDIRRYGCAGLYNSLNKDCQTCKVVTKCKEHLNPIVRMPSTDNLKFFRAKWL